jgi:hypothetical protein
MTIYYTIYLNFIFIMLGIKKIMALRWVQQYLCYACMICSPG